MKRVVSVSVAFLVLVLFTGCYKIELTFVGIEDGSMAMGVGITGDETMAGDEICTAGKFLLIAFPEIRQQYDPEIYERGDSPFNKELAFVFHRKKALEIEELKIDEKPIYMKNEDGSYSFYLSLKVSDIDIDTEPQKGIMTVLLKMPKKIESSNSMQVVGRGATWHLTKMQVKQGVTLVAKTN